MRRLLLCLMGITLVAGVAPASARPAASARPQSWSRGQPLVLKVSVVPHTTRTLDIRGLYLGYIDRVSVDGRPATQLKRISPTQVQAVAPSGTNGHVELGVSSHGTNAPPRILYGHSYLAVPRVFAVARTTNSGGESVDIAGANLAGATRVIVGGVDATHIQSNYSTRQLRLRFPPHDPGFWHVRVVTPYATSAASDADKTYYSTPRPIRWTPDAPHDQTRGQIKDMSCLSDDFCAASDDHRVYTLTAGVGSQQHDFGDRAYVTAIECTAASFCIAGFAAGTVRIFDGTVWSPALQLTSARINDISCAATTFCVALAENGRAYRYDGEEWDAGTSLGFPHGNDISCPTTEFCAATSDSRSISFLRDGVWTFETLESLGSTTQSIDCPSPSFCALSDEAGGVSFRRDGTWSHRTKVFPETRIGRSLGCSSPSACVAVSGVGTVASWDGSTWTPERYLPGTVDEAFSSVSCSPARCVVSGGPARAFVHDTSGWSVGGQITTATSYSTSISCVDAHFCVTADAVGTVQQWDGTHWSSTAVDPGTGQSRDVDCVDRTFCVLVGPEGHVATWNGVSWSDPIALWPPVDALHDGTHRYWDHYLTSVSCTGPQFCMALSVNKRTYARWDGSTWTTAATGALDDYFAFPTVACATPELCLFGYRRWNGATWQYAPDQPDLDGVSCPSADFCAGANDVAYFVLRDGSSHTQPLRLATYISCTSSAFCASIYYGEQYGAPRTWNGRYFSDPGTLPGGHEVNDLSCWAPNHCVAISADQHYIGTPR